MSTGAAPTQQMLPNPTAFTELSTPRDDQDVAMDGNEQAPSHGGAEDYLHEYFGRFE